MPEIELPHYAPDLFEPRRYKGLWGGRGSGKSHTVAQALVLLAMQRPLRVLCCREIQKSIRSSVKMLLADKIERTAPRGFFNVLDTEIRGANGSLFTFAGLWSHADSVKSTEGIDIAWVEEAQSVSKASLDILIPTVRKPNSELWFTWNPDNASDPVDELLRGPKPPPRSYVARVNWTDNKWFPDVLREEMEWCRDREPDRYAHIWLGEYQRNSEARVFHNWRVEEFDTHEDAEFDFGADWGFSTDPTALVRQYVKGRTLYVDYEYWGLKVETDHLPAKFDTVPGARDWLIRADSARPETISYMRRQGFRISAADKGPNSVKDGVEFLRAHDIVVHPRCRHVIDELTLYSYKTDPKTSAVLPILEDKNNHCIDAMRYGLEARMAYGRVQPSIFQL